MSQEEVVVISAVRSPFGKFGGALRDFTLPKLGGVVVAEAIRRAGVAPQDVEEVATGVNLPGSDRSIARQLLISAGIPPGESPIPWTGRAVLPWPRSIWRPAPFGWVKPMCALPAAWRT